MGSVRRRSVLTVAAAGWATAACSDADSPADPDAPSGAPGSGDPATDPATDEAAAARRQPGVDTPVPRQRFLALRVLDLAEPAAAAATLATLGEAVAALPDADGLTVTVGVGPAVVRATRGPDSIGAADLPDFASDAFEGRTGGDLMLQVCADRRPAVSAAAERLVAALGDAASDAWDLDGYRGEVDGVGARNVVGFYDGIAVPTSAEALDADVWTGAEDDLPDATICVVRRIRMDRRRFTRLPVAEQEEVFGRFKKSGAPLSGGGIDADVNLQAKSDSGVYDIANDAHVRRAHPLFSGAGALMLRRSYSYHRGSDDEGLAFVCFQRDLTMFVRTQNSMDGGDRLLDFATTTGSGTFLVLPAATPDRPLGADLRV